MAVREVVEMDILPTKEGSIGKVRIVHEGIGEIKNNKLIVRDSEIVEVDFKQSNLQNQQKHDSL